MSDFLNDSESVVFLLVPYLIIKCHLVLANDPIYLFKTEKLFFCHGGYITITILKIFYKGQQEHQLEI